MILCLEMKLGFHSALLWSCVLQEIHGLLKQGVSADKISSQLSPWASALFEFLPPFIKKQVPLIYCWNWVLRYDS